MTAFRVPLFQAGKCSFVLPQIALAIGGGVCIAKSGLGAASAGQGAGQSVGLARACRGAGGDWRCAS